MILKLVKYRVLCGLRVLFFLFFHEMPLYFLSERQKYRADSIGMTLPLRKIYRTVMQGSRVGKCRIHAHQFTLVKYFNGNINIFDKSLNYLNVIKTLLLMLYYV